MTVEINNSTRPEDVVETTQSIRLLMVKKLTNDGAEIPTDPKEVATLNGLLNSLDTTAQTTRKLDVEEKGIDVASKASANVAAILRQLGGNPFRIDHEAIDGEAVRLPDRAPQDLPKVVQVPGQTLQGMDELKYEEFVIEN